MSYVVSLFAQVNAAREEMGVNQEYASSILQTPVLEENSFLGETYTARFSPKQTEEEEDTFLKQMASISYTLDAGAAAKKASSVLIDYGINKYNAAGNRVEEGTKAIKGMRAEKRIK